MIFDKINEKDRRTLKVGGAVIGLIIVFGTMNILLGQYSKTKKQLDTARLKFSSIMPNSDGSLTLKQTGLYEMVPVFELPETESIPGDTFRKLFAERLKKANINFTVLNFQPISNKKNAFGFRQRNIHCESKCTFPQAMDLLAGLYEIPYFVGIEEFKMVCDPKNKSQIDLTVTVSAFVK